MKIKTWILLCVAIAAFSSPINAAQVQEQDTMSIWVNGLCGMCKNRIENAALKVRGVDSADWNIESRMLKVKIARPCAVARRSWVSSSASNSIQGLGVRVTS